ncbi:hypothetical protein Q7P35_006584 [Cladosporium inversicolor]
MPTEDYHLLHREDAGAAIPEQNRHDRRRSKELVMYGLYACLAITTITLGMFVGVSMFGVLQEQAKAAGVSGPALHCGDSSTEAQSLGCVFDLLTNNWLPIACSDPYTDSEYRQWVAQAERKLGPFAFFRDENFTRHIHTEDELSIMVGTHVKADASAGDGRDCCGGA